MTKHFPTPPAARECFTAAHGDAAYHRGLARLQANQARLYEQHASAVVHTLEVGDLAERRYRLEKAPLYPMDYGDVLLGLNRQPIYDGARALLARELAHPEDIIETRHNGRLCMYGVVGEIAKWTVVENKHGNPTFQLRLWRPFPEIFKGGDDDD